MKALVLCRCQLKLPQSVEYRFKVLPHYSFRPRELNYLISDITEYPAMMVIDGHLTAYTTDRYEPALSWITISFRHSKWAASETEINLPCPPVRPTSSVD